MAWWYVFPTMRRIEIIERENVVLALQDEIPRTDFGLNVNLRDGRTIRARAWRKTSSRGSEVTP